MSVFLELYVFRVTGVKWHWPTDRGGDFLKGEPQNSTSLVTHDAAVLRNYRSESSVHVEDDYDMASRVANDFRLIVSTARALPADVTVGHPAFLRAVCLCDVLKTLFSPVLHMCNLIIQ